MGNNRCTDQEVARFGFRLQQLLNAGIPILRALSILETSWNKREKMRYSQLGTHLKSGLSVSEGLRSLSFPLFFCSLISFSEQHGQMSDALGLAATYYFKKDKRKKNLRKTMIYPLLVILSSCCSLLLTLKFLLPQFVSLYATLGVSLPLYVKWFIGLSTFKGEFVYVIITFLLLFLMGGLVLRIKGISFELYLIRIPFIARIYVLHLNSIVCLQSGLLLDGGISMLEICRLFRDESHSSVISRAFILVDEELRKGEHLSSSFAKVSWILPLVVEIVNVAEQSGMMGSSLKQLGEQLEEEFDLRLAHGVVWIQNLLLVCSGGIVLMMLLSLFIPMLSVVGQL